MLEEIRKNRIDLYIVLCVFAFSAISLLAVYSATHDVSANVAQEQFSKQLVWILIGLTVGAIITFLPQQLFFNFAYILYGLLIIALLALTVLGRGNGSERWFMIGGISFQPSEFMKPVLVLTLARFLAKDYRTPEKFKIGLIIAILVIVPFVLVLKQPDLGTSLALIVVTMPILFWRGMSLFTIFVICAPVITFIASFNFWTFFIAILFISIVLYFAKRGPVVFSIVFLLNIVIGIMAPIVWNGLHKYQQERILNFLGFVSDPQGIGYQIIQSKVAIGSGGILGKGFLQGSQTQLRFLPAQHTDFIFSVIAEEWGIIGAFILLAIFLIFLLRGVYIAASTTDRFAGLVTIGLITIFAFQIVINIGMTLGILPVTGIPLPFISYGGSSMLTCMSMAGLIANASLYRYKIYD